MKKVNVLGVEYTVAESTDEKDENLIGKDGYCDTSIKYCAVEAMTERRPGEKMDLSVYKRQVKRHEIIHAFLYESGLESCSEWASNEEMVDWIAIQFPKLLKAFEEADCM